MHLVPPSGGARTHDNTISLVTVTECLMHSAVDFRVQAHLLHSTVIVHVHSGKLLAVACL